MTYIVNILLSDKLTIFYKIQQQTLRDASDRKEQDINSRSAFIMYIFYYKFMFRKHHRDLKLVQQ